MMKFQRRQRTTFTGEQISQLQAAFNCANYPDKNVITELAKRTQLQPKRIQVWFQNQRAKCRKSKTTSSFKSSSPTSSGSRLSPNQAQTVFDFQANEAYREQTKRSADSLSSPDNQASHAESPQVKTVFVFSSETANEAALAISAREFKSILDYHRFKYCNYESQQIN